MLHDDDDDDADSNFSSLASLENTDDFGRKLRQHRRDAQRINNVLHDQGHAFRKARPNPRIALTLDNLERNSIIDTATQGRNASHDPVSHSSARHPERRAPSVTSSVASDPPLNVPREWGRKGRHNTAWLRRINDDGRACSNSSSAAPDRDALHAQKSSAAGHPASPQVDWMAAGDTTVESVEGASSAGRLLSRRPSTPPSMPHQNPSLDRIREWEADQDLTAASLLASTPAIPSTRRLPIEGIRQREVRNVQQRTVATNRLDMLENPPANDMSVSAEKHAAPPLSRPNGTLDARLGIRQRSPVNNKENVPIISRSRDGHLPASSHKSSQSTGTLDREIHATGPSTTPKRPQYQDRSDSMALLRQFARVSSASPSPTAIKQGSAVKKPAAGGIVESPTGIVRGTGRPPQNAPQLNASRQPESPVPDSRDLPVQTPVVTGAWIDTPRTAVRSHMQASLDSRPRDLGRRTDSAGLTAGTTLSRRRSEPHLPSSALAAVLEEARNQESHTDNDPTLGDSTIASLEGLMNHDPAIGDPTITLDIPDSVLHDADVDLTMNTQGDRDRRQEDFALEALDRKLKATGSSIKEAGLGLRKVEQQVEAAASSSTSTSVKNKRVSSLPRNGNGKTHEHRCDGICSSCGRDAGVFVSAWREFCSLYYERDRRAKWGIRLTWLGIACLAFGLWLATETTLWSVYASPRHAPATKPGKQERKNNKTDRILPSSMYCQPTYAYRMHGYGVNPNAPRFPLVLPTLMLGPSRPVWQPVLSLLAWCLGAMYSSDGAAAAAATTAIPVQRAPVVTADGSAWGFGTINSGSKVSWFKSAGVGRQEWRDRQGKVERMNAWDKGQRAWEAPGDEAAYDSGDWDASESMLDDEYV